MRLNQSIFSKTIVLAEATEELKSTIWTESPALNLNNKGKTSQILKFIGSYDLLISSGRVCELFDVFPELKFKYGDNFSDWKVTWTLIEVASINEHAE